MSRADHNAMAFQAAKALDTELKALVNRTQIEADKAAQAIKDAESTHKMIVRKIARIEEDREELRAYSSGPSRSMQEGESGWIRLHNLCARLRAYHL